MIRINTKTSTYNFNLKNFGREKDFCTALTHLQDQESPASVKITTTYDEHLLIKVSDVINFKFEETKYAKGEVHELKPEPKEDDLVDRIMKGRDANKRRRIQKFLNILKAKGAPINPDDPMFRDIIDKL